MGCDPTDPANVMSGGLTGVLDSGGGGSADPNRVSGVGKKYLNLLKAFSLGTPQQLSLAQQYQPQFTDLDISNLQQFLGGVLPTVTAADATANTATRTANLGDLSTLGPGFVNALKSANPGQTALTDALTKTATDNLNLGTTIDPDTAGKITSSVRGNWANRGLGDSMPAGLDEALQLFGGGQNLLQSRETAAGNAANLNANLYEDPLLQMLGVNSPAPTQTGSFASEANAAAGGNGVPSTSDLEGLFSGVYNAGNAASLNSANNNAALCGAGIGAAGSVLGGVGGGMMCWAAREIFGADNPQWLQFREWMLLDAPNKLRKWYLAHGEAWANRLRVASVETRSAVQLWMENKIRLAGTLAPPLN